MIFEVTPEQIELLKDDDLRTLVGHLAEQDVVRAGQSPAGVTYGGDQNAQDGGIDVRVDLGACKISGYIPRPQTGFQVKAADMARGAIEEEMRPRGKLRPSIVRLGEDAGAYIIVSSKGSVADTALKNRKNAMAKAIADEPRASDLCLEFYDRRRLATWVNQHPGLIPWVRLRVGQPLSGWRPYEDWSSSPGPTTDEYFIDDHLRISGARLVETGCLGVTAGIQKLREVLAQPKSSVRIVGLSGVGKTRLVQALFDHAIGCNALDPRLAVYTDLSENPAPAPLELLEHLQNFRQRCVLIVDNCGAALHRKLRTRMGNAESNISLITVEYDISDDEQDNTDTFRLEPASPEIISKIVARRYTKLSQPEVSTIASFSEGNSRIALALAETAQHGASVANLKDGELINRLFRQKHEHDPKLLRAGRACALVYSFEGVKLSGVGAELPRIAALAGESVEDMHAHVAELVRRQLVQKRSIWRALLPHALAHRLAEEALQDFPLGHVRQQLVEGAPERLLRSFSRRLGCLHDSPEAQAIVAQWLSQGGLLEKVEELDELGAIILENVAPVDPHSVLCVIESAINRENIISKRRPYLTRILRSLAYEPALFDKSAYLMVRLAEREAESSNVGTAANVFKSLFYLHLSGTHAGAKQRADFLRSIADSRLEPQQTLVRSGLEAMLKYNHFSSSHGFEFGTRKRDYGYRPKTCDELWGWYREALSLAGDLAERDHLRALVRTMIASRFRWIATALQVTNELVALAERFAADGGWPEGWGGVRSAEAILKKNKRDAEAAKLAALARKLKPRTLEARIASYVLPDQRSALDIAGIDFNAENYESARKKVEGFCEGIGEELAADLSALAQHLPSMLRSNSGSVSTVARTIGREAREPRKAWNTILAEALSPAHEGNIVDFPGAFLAGLSKTNRGLCEELLDESLANPPLRPFFTQMQASVGIDETGTTRLIEALKHETVPVHMYRMLAGGRACDGLSASNLKGLLLAIVAREGGLEIALDILSMRLLAKRSDGRPIEDAEKEAGRELLRATIFERRNQRQEAGILGELVRDCLRSPSDDAVADLLCERLLQGIIQGQVYAWDYGDFVAELGAKFPRSVLDILVERADAALQEWGGFSDDGPCPFRMIPDDALVEWAGQRPQSRFLQLAEVIRPWRYTGREQSNDNDSENEVIPLRWTSTALKILREAPQPPEILNQYVKRFYPCSGSGSLASVLESRLPLLAAFRNDRDLPLVQAAEAATAWLNGEIARQREREARESRKRDERFDW